MHMEVNVFGHCFGASGWAQHTRYFADALGSFHDVMVAPWDSPTSADEATSELVRPGETRPNAHVGIGIGPIEQMPEIAGRYRIGFVVWETTCLPEKKLLPLLALDEVWVPSTWGRAILINNGLPEERVHVIPEGVDPTLFRPFGSTVQDASRPFRFLCVGKWENRKGIEDLALAYSREFRPDEPVELILHCFNPYLPDFSIEGALSVLGLPAHAPIIASQPTSRTSLVDLYNACDAFVIPTKAEAWGLPIIEAMSCGLPTIATNYSGHTEFLHSGNGYLINVADMIPVDDYFFYGCEQLGVWAQPDVEHLQHLMRRAFQDTMDRTQKAQQARQDVIQHWTWRKAAEKAQQRLSKL